MAVLLDPLFRSDAMREIFSDRGRLQGMLDFEAALARAEAAVGLIPVDAARIIGQQCRANRFDMSALAKAAALAGNPAIPTVKALTLLVAKQDRAAAGHVHLGATSQDAMDTGLVLQLRDALEAIEFDTQRLADALAKLARKHATTPVAGRTWLQQAVPVTLGLKAATALSAVGRHRERLRELRARVLVIQFGGAAGTLASLGTRGLEVSKALARETGLTEADLPWHAHRDRVAEVATVLGLLTGTLGKIARDIALLMQTEVAEAFEPAVAGKGGSSTMPHKRNPVAAAVVIAAATRVPALVSTMLSAMLQEHERGLGNWHAEWETLPEICMLCSGALGHLVQAVKGLEVDAGRARKNLDATGGLLLAEAVVSALVPKIGRDAAHALLEDASRRAVERKKPLFEILEKDRKVRAHLPASRLKALLDPSRYLGVADRFVDRALAARAKKK
ncbi:MAG TPA: 3-carboxy-cis,cis-muconate cycloisomerase [Burkholderiales bacterium]|nr:3-carboxy-cis,cis-muconate cycloisomerase [Burkholderiales bacterium]